MHAALETREPAGVICFDAVLALIERFSAAERAKAIAFADECLEHVPWHLRREHASDRSIYELTSQLAFGLIRSLTYNTTAGGNALTRLNRIEGLRHLGVRTGPISKAATGRICDLCKSTLVSLELSPETSDQSTCQQLALSGAISNLTTAYSLTIDCLREAEPLHLTYVQMTGGADAIGLLAEKNSKQLEELSLCVTDESCDELLSILERSTRLLSGLLKLELVVDLDDYQFARLIRIHNFTALKQLIVRPFMGIRLLSGEAMQAFANTSLLRTLQLLDLSGQKLGEEGWRRLGGLDFESLSHLNLERTQGTDALVSRLLNGKWLRRLEKLNLDENSLGPEGASALARCRALSRLQELRLLGCSIDAEGGRALASSPCLNGLRSISIDDVGEAGGAMIRAPWFRGLQHIVLLGGSNESDEDLLSVVARAGPFSQLRSLKLGYGVGDEGALAFSRSCVAPRLRQLTLAYNDISGNGITGLAKSPAFGLLWDLNLDSCPIGDEGIEAIAGDALSLQLAKLHVVNCGITSNGAERFGKSELARSIRWLSIERDLVDAVLASSNVNPLLRARLLDIKGR